MIDKDGHDDGDDYGLAPIRCRYLYHQQIMLTASEQAVMRANVALMRDEDVRRREDERAAMDASF